MLLKSRRLTQYALIWPILITFLISGCATTKPLEVFTKEIERTPLNLELPSPEVMEEVRIIVVTSKNQEEVFAKMKQQGIDPVIFGYSDEDWELVQKNNARMRNHIVQLRAIIEAYQDYYESPKEETDKSKDDFEPKSFGSDDS